MQFKVGQNSIANILQGFIQVVGGTLALPAHSSASIEIN